MFGFRVFAKRFFAHLVTTILFGWAAVKLFMDWVGRSTIADDFGLLVQDLPDMLEWLFSTPWYIPAGLAFVSTAAIIYLNMPTKFPRLTKSRNVADSDLKLTYVENQVFNKTSRILDGYYYKDCSFRDVSLRFDGGDYTIDGGSFDGAIELTSTNNAVNAAFLLLTSVQHAKGHIPPGTQIRQDEFGNVRLLVPAKSSVPEPQSRSSTPA